MTNGTFWEFCYVTWRVELDFKESNARVWVVGAENLSLIIMVWRKVLFIILQKI